VRETASNSLFFDEILNTNSPFLWSPSSSSSCLQY
jgi:hypothetical protein